MLILSFSTYGSKQEKVFNMSFGHRKHDAPLFQVLKKFLDTAEAEVRSLISLYSEVVSPLHTFSL